MRIHGGQVGRSGRVRCDPRLCPSLSYYVLPILLGEDAVCVHDLTPLVAQLSQPHLCRLIYYLFTVTLGMHVLRMMMMESTKGIIT